MERITEHIDYCFLACYERQGDKIREECPIYYNCYSRQMHEKLSHYEDLEEQGRLIELDKQHCDWCDKGAELCGTCRKFFDYHNDGGSDKCSAECKEGACLNYEPMNYCPNCGSKMDGKKVE